MTKKNNYHGLNNHIIIDAYMDANEDGYMDANKDDGVVVWPYWQLICMLYHILHFFYKSIL